MANSLKLYVDPNNANPSRLSRLPNAMQDTFLHEVMHALTAAFDLKEKDKEESFVRRLATGICTVWNDNPKAFKWWRELV